MIDTRRRRNGRWPALSQLVVLVVSLLALALAPPSQVEQTAYDFVFVSERAGHRGIYSMRGDDAQAVAIWSESNAMVFSGSWSPDGGKIAYVDYGPEDEELLRTYDLPFHFPLYLMNPDGSDRERLLDVPIVEFVWSPDSRRLAFTSGYEDPRRDNPRVKSNLESFSSAIYVLELESRKTRRLTPLGDNRFPSWSPDGRRIVLSGEDSGAPNSDLYIVAAEGGDWQQLTDLPTNDVQPAWSPLGDWIAFVAAPKPGRAAQDSGVFVVRPDGSGARRISSALASDVAWSPDGRQVLVSSRVTTLIDMTTGVATELATGALEEMFAPDGEFVLYRSDDEGDWNIYAVDLAGENRMRLTNNPGDDLTFAVSPLLRRTP